MNMMLDQRLDRAEKISIQKLKNDLHATNLFAEVKMAVFIISS